MILCVNCGHRNKDDHFFCTRCGVRLVDEMEVLARLVVMSSAEKGKSFFLSRKPVYIGRGDANDIVLKDEQVSHRHARFIREQDNFWVEDLVSTNGTYLNGTQIHGKEALKDEDLIKIGTTILKFKSP